MNLSDRQPLVDALRAVRAKKAWLQSDMADYLEISRKTYVLLESCRWLPPTREQPHFVKRLHEIDPALADAFLAILGQTMNHYAIVTAPPPAASSGPAQPALGSVEAKRLYDIAIYEASEELDVTPKVLRPQVALVLSKLHASGVTLAEAAAFAGGARAKGRRGE
jgi:hypothetical protein